ncbi:DUF4339 domain-containing protein [Adlercreutzia murintestinalis]|jgi:hypothetical protein|uniref:DUF4339 domain-containing protein n=1 Tax=Adlercreutzia murintestinalis TaxID=2941325 RepID=UPI00203F90CC|nr:DUF4339 domain-containing protein [Adlercreutzia murintestinalis]
MDNDFFYSLDKLVEFGLGTAAATQMIQSMNAGIDNMRTPGVDNSMRSNMEAVYYVAKDGAPTGPFLLTEIARMALKGEVAKESYVWKPGMANWDLVENQEEIMRLIALMPPLVIAR